MEYMSCAEAAAKWGISERRVQKLCEGERIPGAVKFSRVWLIRAGSTSITGWNFRRNESNAASIGKGYPFRKIPVLTLCAGRGFSLVGSFPSPCVSSHSISRPANGICCTLPLTIYNAALLILPNGLGKVLQSFSTQSIDVIRLTVYNILW